MKQRTILKPAGIWPLRIVRIFLVISTNFAIYSCGKLVEKQAQPELASTGIGTASTDDHQAKLRIDVAGQHAELGYVETGQVYDLRFSIRAPDSAPLVISDYQTQCSCTEVLQIPEIIPAGWELPIKIRFTVPEAIGEYRQTVKLILDSADEPIRELTLVARVNSPLRLDQTTIFIDSKSVDQNDVKYESREHSSRENQSPQIATPIKYVVRVTNDGPSPIKLIYAISDHPSIVGRVPKTAIGPGETSEISIVVNGPLDEEEVAVLAIHTTQPTQPQLYLRVISRRNGK